ncbi:DNA helicase/exodeoxyribonuclease V, subunit A [Paenibacillus sp. NFR01]|nr:DNA helicase/exodeoxyribonuclease V, subunit A [Paenibacillus sp. NFR01]
MSMQREIEPKPEGSFWSDDQWRAIAESGDDILVAAAAGSGKTAVLVERIIRKISSETGGFSVDRLLVATFTKAAASEMRQRIREALETKLEEDGENEHLRRQLALLGRASITTLHSFCLEVIRRYYQLIPIDPGFRILNEHEAEMMRQELLEELLEEKYAGLDEDEEDSDFVRLADWFSGERSDDAVHALIQRLHDFARSHPWPEQWLRDTAATFAVPDLEALGGTVWVRSMLQDAALTLDGAAAQLRQAKELALRPGGPAPYADSVASDLEMVEAFIDSLATRPWTELYDIFMEISFVKLKPVKKDSADPALQEAVKDIREQVKKQLLELQKALFGRPAAAYLAELHEAAPLMRELAETVILFGERYRQQKISRGLVDFSDLEHYCLQILRREGSTPEQSEPSDAALEYRALYDEVLLDEYQDTNSVQEEIVRLISRGAPGNRFMVGDMKQSIYRFRLAEPGLFLDKYLSFGQRGGKEPEERSPGLVIDLARNFRSRPEVVNAVNMIFRQVMNSIVAEISYDPRAELVYGANFPGAEASTQDTYFTPELLLIDRGASGGERTEEAGEDGESAAQESETTEAETAQLEARAIARRIAQMTGMTGQPPLLIYDKSLKMMRPVVFGDIVILLRSARIWTPTIIEELRLAGIPAFGEQNKGYFQATEVEVALAILQTIDNPRQDIALAGVLRSPVVGLSEEELSAVRLQAGGTYYDALLAAAGNSESQEPGPETSLEGLQAGADGFDLFGWSAAAETAGTAEESGPAAMAVAAEESEPGATPDTAAPVAPALRGKLEHFLAKLEAWRQAAREGSLPELIWQVYNESGYLEWVGGLPGGLQRQNNLMALYDRAVQFENDTNSRGLFRFLLFINRLRENGGDLGVAGGTGEEAGGVRIMTIHKSKGLEFPVVFLAGMAKAFNRQDLHSPFLVHKELGFGPRFVERDTRVTYPTLPYLAISRRSRLELLAEEMRVLYVGLTRPRDKMILVGTVRDLPRAASAWATVQSREELLLEGHLLARGRSYLDWVGPALIRHPGAAILRKLAGAEGPVSTALHGDRSSWSVAVANAGELVSGAAPADDAGSAERQAALEALRGSRALPELGTPLATEIARRLAWHYPHLAEAQTPAKTSVTELKTLINMQEQPSLDLLEEGGATVIRKDHAAPEGLKAAAGANSAPGGFTLQLRRPQFMEKRGLSPAERGTAYHTVMQHLPLDGQLGIDRLEQTVAGLVQAAILRQEQADAVDLGAIHAFCGSELGRRLMSAPWKQRELPFSYMVPATEAFGSPDPAAPDALKLGTASSGNVMIQGVIDCLFRENGRLVLLDYKTDTVLEHKGGIAALAEKYRFQLELYGKALHDILGEPVSEIWLYFFDGGVSVKL